jgi:hypothetical protein
MDRAFSDSQLGALLRAYRAAGFGDEIQEMANDDAANVEEWYDERATALEAAQRLIAIKQILDGVLRATTNFHGPEKITPSAGIFGAAISGRADS